MRCGHASKFLEDHPVYPNCTYCIKCKCEEILQEGIDVEKCIIYIMDPDDMERRDPSRRLLRAVVEALRVEADLSDEQMEEMRLMLHNKDEDEHDDTT